MCGFDQLVHPSTQRRPLKLEVHPPKILFIGNVSLCVPIMECRMQENGKVSFIPWNPTET